MVELARELIGRKHRVVLVEEACGFGYAFHRQLRQMGVEAYVVATEMLNRKRKTNRRDAGKLLDQLYDFDVNGHKKALRPIRVPTLQEQKSRRLCRMRSQLIKLRNMMEGQGRGLMFDFDFHAVPQGWWGPRKWAKLRAKLLAHDPWLIEMLEHHQRLLIAQQRRIAELDREIARESNYDGRKVAKGLGQTTFASLQWEAIDWQRFANRKQMGSYLVVVPANLAPAADKSLAVLIGWATGGCALCWSKRSGVSRNGTRAGGALRSFPTSLVSTPPPGEPPERKPLWLVPACSPSICGDCKPAAPRSKISDSNQLKPDECRPNLVHRMASLHQSPQRFCRGGFDSAIHAHRNPPMNTLDSWATDRSSAAGRPQEPGRRVRMVVAPVLSLDTRRIRHSALPQQWACADRSLSRILFKGISRTQTEGGDRPKLTNYIQ